MSNAQDTKITVYYDGACPSCVSDRERYEKLAGAIIKNIAWYDITGKEAELKRLGIDPQLAIRELHVRKEDNTIVKELDAYILLMHQTSLLKPLALLLSLPLVRPIFSKIYQMRVNKRLKTSNRI